MILLSNDDGINATGIKALQAALSALDECICVAPDRNCSGASNALTLENPLRLQALSATEYCVAGTPSDCVHVALRTVCPHPDVVIAGINHGANLGDDVVYSGTVAAASEARHHAPAVAISLAGTTHFSSAVTFAVQLVKQCQQHPLALGTILNVNVPDLPWEDIKGVRITRLGARHPSPDLISQLDPRGKAIYWIGPLGEESDAAATTDFAAIAAGYISITPLQLDLTAHHVLGDVARWWDEA